LLKEFEILKAESEEMGSLSLKKKSSRHIFQKTPTKTELYCNSKRYRVLCQIVSWYCAIVIFYILLQISPFLMVLICAAM
jgi:hypothetical protein